MTTLAIKRRPRIHLTIRLGIRVLQQWPRTPAQIVMTEPPATHPPALQKEAPRARQGTQRRFFRNAPPLGRSLWSAFFANKRRA